MFLQDADYKATIKPDLLTIITQADTATRELAERAAEKQMISYIGNRYDMAAIFGATGQERDPLIIRCLVYITLYHLSSHLAPRNIPEIRDTLYKEAIEWLKEVRESIQNPDLPLLSEDEPTKSQMLYGSQPKMNNYY